MNERRSRRRAQRTELQPRGHSARGASPSQSSGSPLPLAKSAFSGRALWVSLALIAVTVVVYAPVWHYDFVNYDDPLYASQNPDVLGGLTWHGVWWAFTTKHDANWFPVTWLSLLLDAQLYGRNAGGYHLTNLLLHLANTLLLLGLLHWMTGALGRSAFVAALFAVHPLHVESVAWVAERKDVLSTLFWMLTLWAYVAYVRQPRRRRYWWVLLLLALGLMAKPMLVTLPFTLLLLDVWPLERISLGGGSPDRSLPALLAEQRSVVFQLVREKLPLFALTVASSIVTFVAQQQGGSVNRFDLIPLNLRVANALVSYVAYIGKMLWPARLAAFYPYDRSLPGWWVAGSVLVLIGVSVAVIRAARRHPSLPVGWLWYLGTLVPVIGLIQVGGQAMADRYTYVPLLGLFVIVAWGIPDLLARWRFDFAHHKPYQNLALPAAAGLVIAACTITARGQLRYWGSSIALWEHTLEITTNNYRAHAALGAILAGQGRVEDAIAHYNEALRIYPDFAEAHYNLGNALDEQGKVSEAIAHYTEALRLQPNFAEAHNNLGGVFANQGRIDDAIHEFRDVLRLQPDLATAHNNLALLLVRKGQTPEAVHHYAELIRLRPASADPHYRLGLLLLREGKSEEAARQFETALTLDPKHQEARRVLDDLRSRGQK